jgi:rod shape-determining protein MreC
MSESFATRNRLKTENETLRLRLRDADLKLLRFAALEQENLRLRAMREATTGITDRVVVAEIMRVDVDPLRHRVILNKGTRDDVFKGQPVLDATGVFGQITRAGAFSSEAILISDTEHGISVQVNRNGLRSIALGTGDLQRLSLPFLPTNADIKAGDLLVTSGLDGVFPAGYPVATVTEVDKEVAQTLASISARPAATLDRDREVLLVWVKQPPAEVATGGQPTTPAKTTPATQPKPATTAPKPPATTVPTPAATAAPTPPARPSAPNTTTPRTPASQAPPAESRPRRETPPAPTPTPPPAPPPEAAGQPAATPEPEPEPAVTEPPATLPENTPVPEPETPAPPPGNPT